MMPTRWATGEPQLEAEGHRLATRRASILACVLAGVLAMGATAAAPAGAAIPGINLGLADLDAVGAGTAPESGARWARVWLDWARVQPAPGVVDERLLGVYTRGARALQARGTRVLIVVTSSPGWASTTGLAGGPPAGAAPYARFVAMIAARLRGTVAAYEIWNEPDMSKFWGGRRTRPRTRDCSARPMTL